jgi:hypothetical protein
MNIKAIFSYPLQSQGEFLKRVKRRHSLIEGVSIEGPFFSFGTGDRITTILILEFDESRYSEAVAKIAMQYDDFHGVPGLSFNMTVSKPGVEEREAVGYSGKKLNVRKIAPG